MDLSKLNLYHFLANSADWWYFLIFQKTVMETIFIYCQNLFSEKKKRKTYFKMLSAEFQFHKVYFDNPCRLRSEVTEHSIWSGSVVFLFFFALNFIDTKTSPTQTKWICPSLTMANSTDDNLLFSYFSQRAGFEISCNLSVVGQFEYYVKICFLQKIKYFRMSSAYK